MSAHCISKFGYCLSPDTRQQKILMIVGPKRVAEQVALMRDVGIRNLMLTNRGLMSREKTTASLRLLSQRVMPLFRDL